MTAITMAPSPAPHDRPSFGSDLPPPSASASAMLSPSAHRTAAAASASASGTPSGPAYRSGSGSPRGLAGPAAAKSSPSSATRNSDAAPKIIVKKEPCSPEPPARHRPRKLDLSKGGPPGAITPQTARPMTARDGLGIQEVGLACLSPGFVTHDPAMKEQLQRSMSVREQQRSIIEARLQQQSAKGDGSESMMKERDGVNQFAARTPGFSRRKGAPPGLSIVAPSHENFANERVIQSAPLGQTFTGINNHPHPLTRHITNQPSRLSHTSHIHHVPAQQTNNRLPPIADVFGQGLSGHPESSGHSSFAQQSAAAARGPMTSPGLPPPPPPPQMAPTPGRPRDYKSAEEVQAEIAGGRAELLPKLVHYGGHQPPTPPSPHHQGHSRPVDSRGASRRRTRAEYEEGASPPLGTGRAPQRRGPFGEGWDSPETTRQKRDEFLRLCERAWDLFHS